MRLNPDLTFQTLIPTAGNRAALEACWEFATSYKPNFNFLLLHGPPAVGKTHLLHAIPNAARKLQPKLRIMLITCETWTDELVTSIRSERTEEFRSKYRQIQMLLTDDVQILIGKPITQQFLADFIQSLIHSGCRVVLTYSGLLSALPLAHAETATRLIIEMRPPTREEMHRVILSKFAIQCRTIPLNAFKAACMYAHGDIRRVEGRLNAVLLQRKFTREDANNLRATVV